MKIYKQLRYRIMSCYNFLAKPADITSISHKMKYTKTLFHNTQNMYHLQKIKY